MKNPVSLVTLAIGAMIVPAAASAAPTAMEIIQKAEDNYRGFRGQRIEAELVLKDAAGAERIHKIVHLTRETPEGRQSLMRFTSPAEISGTALLTWEQSRGPDQQWLYLPKTGDLKQVSGANQSSSFLGSELTFEDLGFPRSDRYEHTLLGEDTIEGRACWKIERKPRYEGSSYSRLVTCFDKERHVVVSVDYFDRAGQLIKQMKFGEYKDAGGGKFRPTAFTVTNLQNKRSTVYRGTKMQTGLDLSANLFSTGQLAKAATN
jgi:hypothetical protein